MPKKYKNRKLLIIHNKGKLQFMIVFLMPWNNIIYGMIIIIKPYIHKHYNRNTKTQNNYFEYWFFVVHWTLIDCVYNSNKIYFVTFTFYLRWWSWCFWYQRFRSVAHFGLSLPKWKERNTTQLRRCGMSITYY